MAKRATQGAAAVVLVGLAGYAVVPGCVIRVGPGDGDGAWHSSGDGDSAPAGGAGGSSPVDDGAGGSSPVDDGAGGSPEEQQLDEEAYAQLDPEELALALPWPGT